MNNDTPSQLRFSTITGMSIRADFDGGAMSSDFGSLSLAGVDRQMGLTDRLAASFNDQRHPSYVNHEL